jgi:tRNA pseudouridine55 synthase
LQVRRIKKPINGILLLDKPIGLSSNLALQKIKGPLQASKAGHTGTLDPLATGLLPLCFGEATKFAHFVTDADKTYIATIKLGITTTTGDAEGEILTISDRHIAEADFIAACTQFVGNIQQTPPMYSALKHEGRPLYEYARAGIEIPRKIRDVTISSLTHHSFESNQAVIEVRCSKGTYIRTLAEDIGRALNCGGHLTTLRRTATANFEIAQSITLPEFEALDDTARIEALLPIDSAVLHLPALTLNENSVFYLQQGRVITYEDEIQNGLTRLYDKAGLFFGLGDATSDGKVAPKRLVVYSN